MDKYQEELIKNIRMTCKNVVTNQEQDCFKDGKIIQVVQNEDITQVKYELSISCIYNTCISKIEVYEKQCYKEVPLSSQLCYGREFQSFTIALDFNKKDISKIKISFKHDIALPVEIDISYIEADKELYYAKKEAKEKATLKDNLLNNLNISCSTENKLVNIKFQNATADVCQTKIELYCKNIKVARYSTDAEKNTTKITEENVELQYMGSFDVEKNMFYKAIPNLTKGDYAFKLVQYDKNNNIVIESGLIDFSVHPTYVGIYYGKNQVVR